MVREVGSNTGHEIGLMMGNEANGAIKHSKPETAQINSLIRFSSLPQQPLVDPLAAYLATLAPKSQAVVKERLATVARLIGVDPAAMPWHELRAHHLDYIRGRLGEEDPLTKKATLAALRGVLKQARNQNLLTDEEYRRIAEVKGARGSRPAAPCPAASSRPSSRPAAATRAPPAPATPRSWPSFI